MNKYAIAMLIFKNKNYISGSIISAYVHKKYIIKNNLNIDLIVMVDDSIYEYKNELLKFFDKVKKINLLELKLAEKYDYSIKYSQWMKYTINKWQIMQYEEYDKILFLDPDFLPLTEKFYEIFDFRTPAVTTKKMCEKGEEIPKTFFMDETDVEKIINEPVESYHDIATKLTSSINATCIMLKPNISLYKEYITFIKETSVNGFTSTYESGIDETSLLLFLRYYKDMPVYCIPRIFSVTPWYDKDYDVNNIYGLNYVSFIKAWTRLPMLQWAEENIWHIIAKNALKHTKPVTEIYVNGLLENLENFASDYKNLTKKSGYNLDVLIHQKNKILPLIHYLKNNKNLKYNKVQDIEKIKKIMDSSKYIHSFMKKKYIFNYEKILQLLDIKKLKY